MTSASNNTRALRAVAGSAVFALALPVAPQVETRAAAPVPR